jgi:hypothetical protein
VAIAAGWTRLESVRRTLIWAAAGLDSTTGMVFTGGKRSSADLLDMLKLLISEHAPDLSPALATISKEIHKAFELRGTYVHSLWTVGEEG